MNIATLRLAIEDTIATFGPRYPKGPQYLKRLAELEEKQRAAEGGTSEQKHKIEDALKSLRREAMLAHPLLAFDRLLFVKRMAFHDTHIYGVYQNGTRGSYATGGNLCILSPVAPDGEVTEIAPQLRDGVFGQFDLSHEPRLGGRIARRERAGPAACGPFAAHDRSSRIAWMRRARSAMPIPPVPLTDRRGSPARGRRSGRSASPDPPRSRIPGKAGAAAGPPRRAR